MQHGIAHARVVEGVTHLLDGGVASAVERDRRAADELNAELQAAHANNHSDEHHGNSSGAQEVLLQAQHVDIELDEAAAHVFAAFGLLLALEIRRGIFAVAHSPEAGVLRDAARRKQANDRRLEQQHHRDVAQNAKRERKAEALDRCAGQEEQRERGNKRYQVGVDGGQDTVAHARDGRGAHAAAHANFLAETLKRKNRRIGGHTDGEHDARDACHRQAEQAEVRKQRQNAQVQAREHGHGGSGDETQAMVEKKQVEHNERQANCGDEHARSKRVLAKRRANGLALRVLKAHRQRTRLEHGLQRLGFVHGVVARDGHVAAGNHALHGRSALHLAVEDDNDFAMVGREVAGRFFKRLGALGIQRDVDRVVRRRLAFLINRHARDVGAGHERRVGTLGHFEVVALFARGEFIASRVGHGFLRDVLAVVNLGFHRFVGEGIEARELELTGTADGVECGLGIGKARNLHEDLVVALQRNRCLTRAERVHAALDDGARLLHVFAGNGIARGALRGKHDRQAALNVEALVDLFLRRHKREH